MIEPQLTLRPTVIGGDRLGDDYVVYSDGRRIGRIRLPTERTGHNPGWDWTINPPLPIPTWGSGSERDLERAKSVFREAWVRFYGSLTPDDIAHWHATADART
jgi:hypothetical protein